MLPGNLNTLPLFLSPRDVQSAGLRANLETHFLPWGRCSSPHVLSCSCPKLSQAGNGYSARTVSCSTNTRKQRRRLCRAATALSGLVPQSVRTSARLRLHHAPIQILGSITTSEIRGAGSPHNRADTFGRLQTAANRSHKGNVRVLLSPSGPRTRAAATSGRQKTRQTRKSITPQKLKTRANAFEHTSQRSRARRTSSRPNLPSLNHHRAPLSTT